MCDLGQIIEIMGGSQFHHLENRDNTHSSSLTEVYAAIASFLSWTRLNSMRKEIFIDELDH